MATQLLPVLSHSRHCWVMVGVGVPVQLPVLRVSVCPTDGVPVIDGGVWLAGGVVGAVTVAVVLVVVVAPVMATQLLPVVSQSSHCWVMVGVGVPVQVPGLRVSVCPAVAVPVIDGGVWFAGGVVGAVTVAVGLVVAAVVPAVL